MSLVTLDPVARDDDGLARLAPRLDGIRGRRIALLSNHKYNAAEFLEQLGRQLVREHGDVVLLAFEKDNTSQPAPAALLDEIAAVADAAITAIGNCGSCSIGTVVDGLSLESRGIPTVVVCTEPWRASAAIVARKHGLDGYPVAFTSVPIWLDSTPDDLERGAAEVVEHVTSILLEGVPTAASSALAASDA